MSSPTRILVIRFSSIGDIVLCTPVLRALKQQLDGEVEIHLITKKSFASIVEPNPYVDNVITIEKHVSEVKDVLASSGYDYVVDLHNNLRSRQVKRIVKAMDFTVDKRNIAKWLYVNTKKEWLPIGHFVERGLSCVAPLGIKDDGLGLDFIISADQQVPRDSLPATFQSEYLTYATGGQMPGKILPTHQIIELCKKLDQPIILLGGKDDEARGEEIVNAVGDKVWNACGKYSLQQSASLIEQSETLITHDTGLMHIGAALKKRVISLWFATTPQIGFAPWRAGAGSEMIEADCSKRPTSKLGNRGYQDGCVFNIDLERVVTAVNF